jgi:hypothetical protein
MPYRATPMLRRLRAIGIIHCIQVPFDVKRIMLSSML